MRFFGRKQQDFADEIDAHLQLETDRLRADGIAPDQAPAAARRAFGNVTLVKERFYDASRLIWLDHLRQDMCYAIRRLRKSPGFTATAVLVLALGTGANTAVFSFVNALLLRPFAFPDLNRLVTVRESNAQQGFKLQMVAPGDFQDWKRGAHGFEYFASYVFHECSLTGRSEPEGVFGVLVSSGFFEALGVNPMLGRTFLPEEENAGRNQVAIVSHRLWVRSFGADASLVGRTISIDEVPYTLVGIMPREFEFPFPGVDIWSPLTLTSSEHVDRREHFLVTVGRLKTGTSLQQAHAELSAVARRLENEYPQTNSGRSVSVVPLSEQQGDLSRPFLVLLQAAAVFVLLIACANVANLQLAQVAGRRKEMALRAALGAGRSRIVRLILAESLLLALAGGAVGAALADLGVRLLKTSVPADTTRYLAGWSQISVDWQVLVFTLAITAISGTAFGLSPAMLASRRCLTGALKEGGQSGKSAGASRLRSTLVVTEVVLTMVIVIGAGQTVKGFQNLIAVYHGFSPDNVLTARLLLPRRNYAEPKKIAEFYDRALRAVSALPGVSSAAVVSNLAGGLRYNFTEVFQVEGRAMQTPGQEASADTQYVSADYFRGILIPVKQGRVFTARDGEGTLPVVVVSEALARRYFENGSNIIGKRLRLGGPQEPWRTVVGVAGDVRHDWFDRESKPTLYLPYTQSPRRQMYLMLRASNNPLSLLQSVRAEIRKIDANLPLFEPKPMPEVIEEATAGMRSAARVMVVFGTIALVLAVLGVYGIMSYGVAQRQREFGIRIALGAVPREVLRLVIGQGLALAAAGIVLGLFGGLVVTHMMAGLLYGLSSSSAAVLIGVPALVAITALLACYVPARAATRVDPMTALRNE